MQSEKIIKEKGHEWMQENPVGTGPYKAREVDAESRSTCWSATTTTGGPKPSYKYVRVRIIRKPRPRSPS